MRPIEFDTIRYEVGDGVALVTVNRPDRGNAWSGPMAVECRWVLLRADTDPGVRVVVLTGAGRAAINGGCGGVGLGPATYADLRWAAASARFATAFAGLGLPAEYGLGWMLSRITGSASAFRLLWDPTSRTAVEAAELGFVQRVVPDDALLEEATSFAKALARHSSSASLRAIKRAVWVDAVGTLDDAYRRSVLDMELAMGGGDFRLDVAAALAKRQPDFLSAVPEP